VVRSVSRAVAALVVVPFLALASAIAPAHAHERNGAHSHAVVHSHFAPHPETSHEHDGSEFEPGAEHIVWLDHPLIHAVSYQFDPPPARLVARIDLVVITSSWSVTVFDDAAPVHGPPRRASSLRGPPHFPVPHLT
jgi:hypothetical protein